MRTIAFDHIRFERGISIPELLRSFGAETIKAVRWPEGFRCLRCASSDHFVVGHGARKLLQCNGCRHQTSLTAGSLMGHTKLPLTTWFLAIYLISQAKTGLSTLALKRQLGVSYPTAWLLHQKINRAMATQDAAHQLSGTVQLDDAYLGDERAGGKVGRGSEDKNPFVGAVSVNDHGHPMYIKLNLVRGLTSEAISKWAKAHLLLDTSVRSDGLACFSVVAYDGCLYLPMVVDSLKPRDLPSVTWVNTVLGNLKTTLAGAYHTLKYRKYAEHYLAGFAYRFNRRLDLRGWVASLIVDVVR